MNNNIIPNQHKTHLKVLTSKRSYKSNSGGDSKNCLEVGVHLHNWWVMVGDVPRQVRWVHVVVQIKFIDMGQSYHVEPHPYMYCHSPGPGHLSNPGLLLQTNPLSHFFWLHNNLPRSYLTGPHIATPFC